MMVDAMSTVARNHLQEKESESIKLRVTMNEDKKRKNLEKYINCNTFMSEILVNFSSRFQTNAKNTPTAIFPTCFKHIS